MQSPFCIFCILQFVFVNLLAYAQSTNNFALALMQLADLLINDPRSPIPYPRSPALPIFYLMASPSPDLAIANDHRSRYPNRYYVIVFDRYLCNFSCPAIELTSHTHQSRGLSKLMSRNLALGNAVFEVFDLILLPF